VIGDILQPTHLIFILLIALLVLGPKRLPEVGRSLGRGIRDFKYALSTESPEHEYSSPSESHESGEPVHDAPASQPPAEATVGHAVSSAEGGTSAPAASGPAEHSS
jgi:sec-independent protein translocase protein TatA